jgi:integrase
MHWLDRFDMTVIKAQAEEIQTDSAYNSFIGSIKSPRSKAVYDDAIKYFMQFLHIGEYYKLLERANMPRVIESDIKAYIKYLQEQRKVAPATVDIYVSAIRVFYDANDIEGIRWNKVNKAKGGYYSVVEDRPYTRDEIKRLLQGKTEQRNRAIILLLSSSGIRVGAIPELKYGHLKAIDKYNLYQIEIYKRYKEKYITFCTPECRKEIDIYLNYRRTCGERITPDSPLFRKTFDRTVLEQVHKPNPITRETIRWVIKELLNTTGVRPSAKMLEGQTHNQRTNLMELHGFRKYFDTNCTFEAGMSTLFSEILMGHNVGLKHAYTKPTPDQLLEGNEHNPGYIDAIPFLTISDESRLRQENEMLKVRKSEIEQLKEKAKEHESFMAYFNPMIDEFQKQIDALNRKLGIK